MANSILVLLLLVCALAWTAERVRMPAPVLYLAGGALYSWAAGSFGAELPSLPYDSEVVFSVFFPVLLYSAAFRMPWNDFRVNAARSVFFGLSNVVLVTLTVGAFAQAAFGLPFALACLLGVCLADPDFSFFLSRANEGNTSRPLRRAVASEGLIEGTAMLLLYLALSDAVTEGAFSLLPFMGEFASGPVIGAVVGALVAWACAPAFRRISSPTLSVTASLALPFLAYLPAQALGGVRLAAVVAAGFVSSQKIEPLMGAQARLTARGAWDALVFLVNGAIYVPAGWLLAQVLMTADIRWDLVAWGAPGAALLILAVRSLWAATGWVLARAAGRELGPWPDMAMGTLGATRGVFALAAVLALPETLANGAPVPNRDLVIALTLGAVAASLVIQAPLITLALRRLPLRADHREERERAEAYAAIAETGLATLDAATGTGGGELRGGTGGKPALTHPSIEALRAELNSVLERYDGETLAPAPDREVRLRVLASQRARLRQLRDTDQISGETFQEIEGEIDRHETYLRNP